MVIKRLIPAILLFFCFTLSVHAQRYTFTEHVSPIIYKNCSGCHKPNGAAPFSLLTYQDVAKRASFIRHVVEERIMPPWKADPEYRSFANEKVLTDREISIISQWVEDGTAYGPSTDLPSMPASTSIGRLFGYPDLILRMDKPVTIKGDNEETYICYAIPFEIDSTTYVKAIAFIPGNKQLAHHASYQVLKVPDDLDMSSIPAYFRFDETDYTSDRHDYEYFNLLDKSGNSPMQTYHDGWLPGSGPRIYPDGVGFLLPRRGVFMIRNMHYAPSPISTTDQTTVHLYFSDKPVERTVMFTTFRPTDIDLNKENIIPADTVVQYDIDIRVGQDLSLFSINPHMHRLARNFRAWATTPRGVKIPLIDIPQWDFNWQEFYQFKKLLHIPKGSVIHAEAAFDNTRDNPENPNFPPEPVLFERGMGDKDEMMRLTFLFLPYQQGDEKRSMNKYLKLQSPSKE
ncbi:MAG: cytochrome c [Cyclobacteriaceae bacterium]